MREKSLQALKPLTKTTVLWWELRDLRASRRFSTAVAEAAMSFRCVSGTLETVPADESKKN